MKLTKFNLKSKEEVLSFVLNIVQVFLGLKFFVFSFILFLGIASYVMPILLSKNFEYQKSSFVVFTQSDIPTLPESIRNNPDYNIYDINQEQVDKGQALHTLDGDSKSYLNLSFALNLVLLSVGSALEFYVLNNLIKFVNNLKEKKYFVLENCNLLRKAGILSLIIVPIDIISNLLIQSTGYLVESLILGLFLLILSTIFKEGSSLKEETELTV